MAAGAAAVTAELQLVLREDPAVEEVLARQRVAVALIHQLFLVLQDTQTRELLVEVPAVAVAVQQAAEIQMETVAQA